MGIISTDIQKLKKMNDKITIYLPEYFAACSLGDKIHYSEEGDPEPFDHLVPREDDQVTRDLCYPVPDQDQWLALPAPLVTH